MATKSKTTKTSPQESTAAEQSFRSYNRVQLAGRLVADPDLRNTPSGKSVCRMRVATNDTREAQFHDVVAWESVGEAAKSLCKGAAVTIEGRLQTRTWEAADGSPRRATEIVAASVKAA
jgi:single-strand DNA-binding protein